MPEAAQGSEGMACVPCAQEDDRRLQRPVSAVGVDGQQGDEAASLAAYHGRDQALVRAGERGILPEAHPGGTTSRVQGGHRGHLHLRNEGEGHRGQVAAGDQRVVSA